MKILSFAVFVLAIIICYFAVQRLTARQTRAVPKEVLRDNLHERSEYKRDVLQSTIQGDLERTTEARTEQAEELPQ